MCVVLAPEFVAICYSSSGRATRGCLGWGDLGAGGKAQAVSGVPGQVEMGWRRRQGQIRGSHWAATRWVFLLRVVRGAKDVRRVVSYRG